MWETVIVILTVLAAAIGVVYGLCRSASGNTGCTGCRGGGHVAGRDTENK